MLSRLVLPILLGLGCFAEVGQAADPAPKLPPGVKLEERPTGPKATKIVLVAGSNYYKPGEHEYVAGCAVLMDLLRQTPGVFPVLAVDWPTRPDTFAEAKAVVLFLDGGDKHAILKDDRLAEVQKLVESGVGLVQLHQVADYPKDLADRARSWTGAAWENGVGQRAHWVTTFKTFPDHPVCRGVKPFTINDGWLYQLRFIDGKTGVTPLLRTVNPKSKAKMTDDAAIVSWVYERPAPSGGKAGRSFTFTGGHLHASFAEEGYRRFLVNGIVWSAGLEIPTTGTPVVLDTAELKKYLATPPAK
jgi:type 1 glutamine amidotransferase